MQPSQAPSISISLAWAISKTLSPTGASTVRSVPSGYTNVILGMIYDAARFAETAQTSINLSTSSTVFSKPRLIRMAQRDSALSTPIASRTWLSATFPDEHAEPALTETPAGSKSHNLGFRIGSRQCDREVFAIRGTFSPKTTASGTAAWTRRSSSSIKFSIRPIVSRRSAACFAATPNPAIPATFSTAAMTPFLPTAMNEPLDFHTPPLV